MEVGQGQNWGCGAKGEKKILLYKSCNISSDDNYQN
jgi:hypothetical protein